MFSIDEIINSIETWLVSGKLNPDILSENFKFVSPFWESNDKKTFLEKFLDPTTYIKTSLSKITKFDPIIKLKDINSNNTFAIILQYHTQNGNNVYETVLGIMDKGLLKELRSIYDLNATQKALDL